MMNGADRLNAHVEEMKLIGRAANRVGKQKDIPLEPGNLLGRILKTHAGRGAHSLDRMTLQWDEDLNTILCTDRQTRKKYDLFFSVSLML